jgi:hypothetical protein
MKQILVICTLLFALTSIAQPSAAPESLAVQLRDKELNELIFTHNADAANEYYDSKFILTTSTGIEKSKDDILREISMAGLTFELNETTDVVVRVRASTAVLTGVLHQKGKLHGKSFDVRLRVTDTWHLTDGKWIILAGHASRL